MDRLATLPSINTMGADVVLSHLICQVQEPSAEVEIGLPASLDLADVPDHQYGMACSRPSLTVTSPTQPQDSLPEASFSVAESSVKQSHTIQHVT